jgi:hypothetical protein
MNVDVFLDQSSATRPPIERALSAYPDLFHVRWHSADSLACYTQLYIASLPLDPTTGHVLVGEGTPPTEPYASYGYYSGIPISLHLPALALFDRLALLPSEGGPPRQLRPGVWEVPFVVQDLFRAALHQSLEAALAELRQAYAQLRAARPGILELPAAAHLLHVTPAALHRALRKDCTRRGDGFRQDQRD